MKTTKTVPANPGKGRPSIDELMAWENGDLELDDQVDLFTRLRDHGMLMVLQGMYGRHARALGVI